MLVLKTNILLFVYYVPMSGNGTNYTADITYVFYYVPAITRKFLFSASASSFSVVNLTASSGIYTISPSAKCHYYI